MAAVHLYVRVSSVVSNAAAECIVSAYEAVRDAVQAAGGEWRGSAQVQFDSDVAPSEPVLITSEPEPDEAVSEDSDVPKGSRKRK